MAPEVTRSRSAPSHLCAGRGRERSGRRAAGIADGDSGLVQHAGSRQFYRRLHAQRAAFSRSDFDHFAARRQLFRKMDRVWRGGGDRRASQPRFRVGGPPSARGQGGVEGRQGRHVRVLLAQAFQRRDTNRRCGSPAARCFVCCAQGGSEHAAASRRHRRQGARRARRLLSDQRREGFSASPTKALISTIRPPGRSGWKSSPKARPSSSTRLHRRS